MRLQIIVGIILLNAVGLNAQQSTSPTSNPPRVPQTAPGTVKQISDDTNDRFRQLQDMGVSKVRDTRDQNILNENIQSIYRKPKKEETKILAPDTQLLAQYQSFLRQSNTGIIKLNADSQCAVSAQVVNVSENCLQYKMPGGGTAFSFRVNSYRIPRLADLILDKNVLKTDSILQHGILVNLGNTSLDEITIQSKGLKYLVDFKPAVEKEDLAKIDQALIKGIKADGFDYRLGFYAAKDTTFALRSVAYRAVALRSVNGVVYDEFQFDKRRDVVVAFRVIDVDQAGNVTILWKVLQQQDSPNLKIDGVIK